MKRRNLHVFEPLERRLCLTVAVQVDNGDLIVDGQSDGPVEITAVAEGTFQVVDDGAVIAILEGVDDDIRIDLDAGDASADDTITLDLAGQAVDRVIVDLGDGDNSFLIQGGTVGGSLKYRGGDGDDLLEIAADTVIEKGVYACLADGENTLLLEGQVDRNLTVHSGSDDDVLQIEEGARIERDLRATLGDGDNTVTIAGEIGRGLTVRAGSGDDIVEMLADALVERSASISLDGGDNELIHAGIVEGNLLHLGADDNDVVAITEEAIVGGNACLRLGGGDNSATHLGDIEGNLRVSSANEEDLIDIDDGNVGGETEVNLGEEFVPDQPDRHCGRGRFGGLFRGFFGSRFGGRSFGFRGFWH